MTLYNVVQQNFNHSFKTRTGSRLGKGIGSLSQWSNHWLSGWTAWKNRIKSVDLIVSLGLYNKIPVFTNQIQKLILSTKLIFIKENYVY